MKWTGRAASLLLVGCLAGSTLPVTAFAESTQVIDIKPELKTGNLYDELYGDSYIDEFPAELYGAYAAEGFVCTKATTKDYQTDEWGIDKWLCTRVSSYSYDANGSIVKSDDTEKKGEGEAQSSGYTENKYTYNSSGNIVKRIRSTFDEEGNVTDSDTYEFTYDSNGRLFQERELGYDSISEYTYYENGDLHTAKEYNPNDNFIPSEKHYDANGNTIYNNTFYADGGNSREFYTAKYDDNNRLIQSTSKWVYADGSNEETTTKYSYEFDSRGNVIKQNISEITKQDTSGTVQTTNTVIPYREFEYDTAGRKTKEVRDVNETFSRTYTYAYDGKGNLVEAAVYYENTERSNDNRKNEYTYNESGNLICVKQYHYNNTVNDFRLDEVAEYDNNGNRTKITRYALGDDGQPTVFMWSEYEYSAMNVSPCLYGHKTAVKNVKSATCTEAGYTGDAVCTACGANIKTGSTISATGHKWDAGKVTTQPTTAKEGIKTYTCTVCRATKTEAVAKLPAETKPTETKPTETKPTTGSNPFKDVPANTYYTDAVQWAVDKGVTVGTSATTFAPDMVCSRAQIVTMLYRNAGSPAVSGNIPFTDVPSDAYYAKAVQWAVSKGITVGTSATTFEPDMTCTRAQAMTLIWRANGKPTVKTGNPFKDVPSNQYYTDAVLWAVDKGVTVGTSATTFAPDMTCTRAQIVTLLYRNAA